ncbi:MAG: hypothetical protein NUV76_12315 [Candidatus Kuenenia sp.]|nr:hypothetical protein [Candidatus Kuenenia sp.]
MIIVKQILVTIAIMSYSTIIYSETSDRKWIKIAMALIPLITLPVIWLL